MGLKTPVSGWKVALNLDRHQLDLMQSHTPPMEVRLKAQARKMDGVCWKCAACLLVARWQAEGKGACSREGTHYHRATAIVWVDELLVPSYLFCAMRIVVQ